MSPALADAARAASPPKSCAILESRAPDQIRAAAARSKTHGDRILLEKETSACHELSACSQSQNQQNFAKPKKPSMARVRETGKKFTLHEFAVRQFPRRGEVP